MTQAEALGILGVNLIHGALTKGGDHYNITASLMDDLSRSRVEVPGHTFLPLQEAILALLLKCRNCTCHTCCRLLPPEHCTRCVAGGGPVKRHRATNTATSQREKSRILQMSH